jgi:hypothetical protein
MSGYDRGQTFNKYIHPCSALNAENKEVDLEDERAAALPPNCQSVAVHTFPRFKLASHPDLSCPPAPDGDLDVVRAPLHFLRIRFL